MSVFAGQEMTAVTDDAGGSELHYVGFAIRGFRTMDAAKAADPGLALRVLDRSRDWQRSSAAPYRLCDQWVLKLADWTDPRGHRTLDMIPMWAFNRPLAKVNEAETIVIPEREYRVL